jgi:hypothetical protein
LKWIALIVAVGLALAAGPASAGVGLLATKGEPLRVVAVTGHPGLLTSTSTRIPGLIAADDLDHPERIGSIAVPDPQARMASLARRFQQLHETRRWAYTMLAVFTIAAILIALWRRTGFWARLCVAIAPAMLAVSLLLGLAGAARSAVVLPVLALGSIALAVAAALPRRLIVWVGPAILLLFLVVLWAWPETAGFSTIGPRPEEGGRFYGINNLVETVLLAISLFSAAELGLASVLPIGALALVTVGWSRTGADGGGLIVFAAAFAFLGLRKAGRITWQRLAVAAGSGIVLVLAFIGVDEASGGHSHVTRAFEKGPGAWFGDLGHRLHLSADRLNDWGPALIVALSLVALLWLVVQRVRWPGLDALLVGIAVSLLVNDAPTDVAAGGAISGFVLWTWTVTRYTRARAPADPDPGGGGLPGGRLRLRGHDEGAARDGDRKGPD